AGRVAQQAVDHLQPPRARGPGAAEASRRLRRRARREFPSRNNGALGPRVGRAPRGEPRLVMVRISAFGQSGPARERPGFGRIAAAVSGASYLSGHPDRPPVSPGTPTIPDYLAGAFGAFGTLTALRHRDRTGEGQVVDIGLYEPMLRMLDELIPVYGA